MSEWQSMQELLSEIASAGFFKWLFSWKKIKAKADIAQSEWKKFEARQRELEKKLVEEETENRHEKDTSASLKQELEARQRELVEVKKKLAVEESVEEERQADYQRRAEALTSLMKRIEERQQRAEEVAIKKAEEYNEKLSTAWQRHEQDVSETIQEIAKKYGIIRCEKGDYPYPGTPDNVLLIGDLYTIFDAKSPKNPEDLKNFPNYLKAQAEGMKKYCQKEKVRNIAFFVVPSSTIESLDTFMYQLASYTVYIITPEALLPILQMLKYLEAYDFTDQLSPEDRDKLCCFIGKLTYTTKRKIQIDNYFSKELITSLKTIDTLPNYIGENIDKYERTEKLNPPMDKRQKIVQIKDIASDIKKVENEILGWLVLDAKTDDPDIKTSPHGEEAKYIPAKDSGRDRQFLIQEQKSD